MLKESDAVKFEAEKETIELEKKCHQQDVVDREEDRAIRQEEPESLRLEGEAQREFMCLIKSSSRAQMQAVLRLVSKLLCSRNVSSY